MRPKNSRLSRDYLRQFLASPLFQRQIEMWAAGSAQVNYGPTHLKQMFIALPPLREQQEIGEILGTLDDKIELNRRMNRTLEEIARAIFRSWFVDFDPVRAKAEGRQPAGMDAETAALFPDAFVDSELGFIPAGWRVAKGSTFLTSRATRAGSLEIEEYSATTEGIFPRSERFKKNLSQTSHNNKVAYKGDLVFGLSRQVLNFGVMRQKQGAFSPVYEVFEIAPETIRPEMLEEYIRIEMWRYIDVLKPGAREGQPIDRNFLLAKSFLLPPRSVQEAYFSLVDPCTAMGRGLEEESLTLTAIRDLLLPKLLSGELRVPVAEEMVAGVTA